MESLHNRLCMGAGQTAIDRVMANGFQCAACGEWNETSVDPSAGRRQQYVEDCQVCCKPNVLTVTWEPEEQRFEIAAAIESD